MRNKAILTRLTEKELVAVQEEADKLGIPVAAFIRLLIKQWSNGIRFERKESSAEQS